MTLSCQVEQQLVSYDLLSWQLQNPEFNMFGAETGRRFSAHLVLGLHHGIPADQQQPGDLDQGLPISVVAWMHQD